MFLRFERERFERQLETKHQQRKMFWEGRGRNTKRTKWTRWKAAMRAPLGPGLADSEDLGAAAHGWPGPGGCFHSPWGTKGDQGTLSRHGTCLLTYGTWDLGWVLAAVQDVFM